MADAVLRCTILDAAESEFVPSSSVPALVMTMTPKVALDLARTIMGSVQMMIDRAAADDPAPLANRTIEVEVLLATAWSEHSGSKPDGK